MYWKEYVSELKEKLEDNPNPLFQKVILRRIENDYSEEHILETLEEFTTSLSHKGEVVFRSTVCFGEDMDKFTAFCTYHIFNEFLSIYDEDSAVREFFKQGANHTFSELRDFCTTI